METGNATFTATRSVARRTRSPRRLAGEAVLAALDDAIDIEKKTPGAGVQAIIVWAESAKGQQALAKAEVPIESRPIEGLVAFVRRGVKIANAYALKRTRD